MQSNIRTIVVLQAIDWGIMTDQVSSRTDFQLTRANLVGFLVSEDEEKIVIAPQWFTDEGIRCTLVVPQVCVERRRDIVFSLIDESWTMSNEL